MQTLWTEFIAPLKILFHWSKGHIIKLFAIQVLILGGSAFVFSTTHPKKKGHVEIWMTWPGTNQLSSFFEALRDAELNGKLAEFWGNPAPTSLEAIVLDIPKPGEPKTLDPKKFKLNFEVVGPGDGAALQTQLEQLVKQAILNQKKIHLLLDSNQKLQEASAKAILQLEILKKNSEIERAYQQEISILQSFLENKSQMPDKQTHVKLSAQSLSVETTKPKRPALLCLLGLESAFVLALVFYFLVFKPEN